MVHVNLVPKTFGPQNPDRKFALCRRTRSSGMFSNVAVALFQTKAMLDSGIIPIVDWSASSTYKEPSIVQGTGNPWEYYFHQPTEYSLRDASRSKFVFLYDFDRMEGHMDALAAFLDPKDPELCLFYEQYLRPKQYILDAADQFCDAHFKGKRILGVHFRGGDMKRAPGHPIPPRPEDMIKAVTAFLEKHPADGLFLVTEEMEYALIFQKIFKDFVILADEFRGTATINPYTITPPPRELHRYTLGKEAVINTLLLSRADYLIASGKDGAASGSNMSLTAQILKKNGYKAMELLFSGMQPEHVTGNVF